MVSSGTSAAFLSAVLGLSAAWGPDGHTVVAHVANGLLSQKAEQVLRAELGNTSLTDAADWPDTFDHTPQGEWSSALHYINYPGRECDFNWARDCTKDWCNVGAIVNFTHQVFDHTLSLERRFMALKFVIHMMGDLHQPLHVASAEDQGGNLITLNGIHFSADASNWSDRQVKLHAAWDTSLVVEAIADFEPPAAGRPRRHVPEPPVFHDWKVLATSLQQRLAAEWKNASAQWREPMNNSRSEASLRQGLSVVANETAALGCGYAYTRPNGARVKSGDVLDRAYYLRAKPVVEEQLAKGGVRLAMLLSEALDSSPYLQDTKDTKEKVLMI